MLWLGFATSAEMHEVQAGDGCLHLRRSAQFRSPSLQCLPSGTPLDVQDSGGNYVQVTTPHGQRGFVHRRYIRLARSGPAPGAPLSARNCAKNISSTVYFLPVQGDNARIGLKKNTDKFNFHVKLQGSGVLPDGRRISYTGAITRPPKNCTTTVTSAARKCLLSYFSVAADVKQRLRLGDIVYVPSMKGKRITLPDSGQVIEHPGLFIVHDVGGAIKGGHRMDFFTGKDNPLNSTNQFAKLGLGDKNLCNRSYQRITPRDAKYKSAYEMIYSMTDSTKTQFNSAPALAQAVASEATR